MNKKFFGVLVILSIAMIFIYFAFFKESQVKNYKIGNNITNQEIVNNILKISSYEVKIEVEVQSNKNTNKYILKQKYISPNNLEQEVIEPENINGVKIIKNKNELKIENSKLSLSKLYNNYQAMIDNNLDLISFIEDYKNNEKSYYEENENIIIMKTECQNSSKYMKYKDLYIDKYTMKPTKMEIKDDSKKTLIYILYNEVKF